MNERGQIVPWLLKLGVGLAIAGVILFDLGSIFVNVFTLDSGADEIAIAVSTDTIGAGGPLERQINEEAEALAANIGARVVEVEVDLNARTVRIVLRRRADTLLVGRIGFISDWARATAEGQSGLT